MKVLRVAYNKLDGVRVVEVVDGVSQDITGDIDGLVIDMDLGEVERCVGCSVVIKSSSPRFMGEGGWICGKCHSEKVMKQMQELLKGLPGV